MKRMIHDDEMKGRLVPLPERRRLLSLLGSAALSTMAVDLRAQAGGSRPDSGLCLARPEQTEGPYFVDAKLLRSDLRRDPADGSIRPGVPLRLSLRLAQISAGVCAPLSGAIVDVWHNDARGEYSDVRDRRYDNRGKKFLRGYQVTDANGVVRFDTIYPGWYPGRTAHVHFKIRTSPADARGQEFTSQLYFDDAVTDMVHAAAEYAVNGQRKTRNEDDRIFRKGGRELMLSLRPTAEGFEAEFDLGLISG